MTSLLNSIKKESIRFSEIRGLDALYVYGSCVSGNIRKESDVDIAILPSPEVPAMDRLGMISQVEGITSKIIRNRAVSIVDLRGKTTALSLVFNILTRGELLYERNGESRIEFELYVKEEYHDFVPFIERLRTVKYGRLFPKA